MFRTTRPYQKEKRVIYPGAHHQPAQQQQSPPAIRGSRFTPANLIKYTPDYNSDVIRFNHNVAHHTFNGMITTWVPKKENDEAAGSGWRYDKTQYETERLFATAKDGTKVPNFGGI